MLPQRMLSIRPHKPWLTMLVILTTRSPVIADLIAIRLPNNPLLAVADSAGLAEKINDK
jgi:hypothetical protein